MTRLLRHLWAWEPILHTRWELLIMRILFALLLWDTQSAWAGQLWDLGGMLRAIVANTWTWDINQVAQAHPNGIAHFVDLTWLSNDAVEFPCRVAMLVSLVAYIAGVPGAFSLLIPMLFGVLTATLANSQGSIGHTTQALHQVTLGIWVASAWSQWRKMKSRPLWRGMTLGQVEAEVGRQVLVAGYVVSAVSKLIESKAQWFIDARYTPLQMVKNNDMKFYQTLDAGFQKLEGISLIMLEHPLLCQLMFGIGLPLELLAFLGLRNRRMALIFGLLLFTFHYLVNQLMSLFFFFNMGLLLTFMICPWYWLSGAWKRERLAGEALA